MADSPRQILENYKQIIIDALADSLEKNERVAQAMLRQSISINIRSFATNMVMEISMADYWKFVDKGVDGTMRKQGSPYKFKKGNIKQDAVKKFALNRGITSYKKPDGTVIFDTKKDLKDRKGKSIPMNKKFKTLYWLIGRGIARNGIKPTNFVDEAFDNNILDNMSKDLSTALGREILIDFNLNDI